MESGSLVDLDAIDSDHDEPSVKRPRKRPRGPGRRSDRSRYYCWTLNNYTEDEERVIARWVDDGTCTYVIYGYEVAPQTGTPHLQGYLELRNERGLAPLKDSLGLPRLHLEQRKWTQAQAIDYCRKAGPELVREFGQAAPGQGSRSDLECVRADIESGKYSELELWQRNFSAFVRYSKGLERYRSLKRTFDRTTTYEKKTVFYYCGSTGTGKSSRAANELAAEFGIPYVYIRPPSVNNSTCWFEGLHDGVRAVVLDEFRGDIPLTTLLRFLDGYDMSVEFKGGSVNSFYIRKIIITSNLAPWELYPGVKEKNPELVKPLYRRIDKVLFFPPCRQTKYGPVCTLPEDYTKRLDK